MHLDLQGNTTERNRQRCGCLTTNVLHAVAGDKGEAFAGQEEKLKSIGSKALKVPSLGRILSLLSHHEMLERSYPMTPYPAPMTIFWAVEVSRRTCTYTYNPCIHIL